MGRAQMRRLESLLRILSKREWICLGVFIAVGVAVTYCSLGYPWYRDDLHLLRTFSSHELAYVWVGDWDPDKVETAGFRPLTTWFNHFRSVAFGESVVAHRLFLIVLFAGYLTLLSRIAARLTGEWLSGFLAAIICLTAKYNFYHVVWISDGIHLAQWIPILAAALFLFRFLDSGRTEWSLASLACAGLALLIREDSLAGLPIIIVLAAGDAILKGEFSPRRNPLLRYTAWCLLMAVMFWGWRAMAVPSAIGTRGVSSALLGLELNAWWTISLAGHMGWRAGVFLTLFVAHLALLPFLEPQRRRMSLVWLICALIACTPGLLLERMNLLLLPISFYALSLATVLSTSARNPLLKWVSAAVLIFVVATSSMSSRMIQLTVHPLSAEATYWDWTFLHGSESAVTIPPKRRTAAVARLEAVGVTSPAFDFAVWYRELRRNGRVGFRDDKQAFMPEETFLVLESTIDDNLPMRLVGALWKRLGRALTWIRS